MGKVTSHTHGLGHCHGLKCTRGGISVEKDNCKGCISVENNICTGGVSAENENCAAAPVEPHLLETAWSGRLLGNWSRSELVLLQICCRI